MHRRPAPQVVFLGSSLVLVPLAGVDADFLNKRLDGSAHHNSVYFERKFAERTGIKADSYNFALPGEMPSDAYMITSFLLKGEHKPDLLVYGVGPRDFMDNLLPSPAATDPYKFLSRFGDVTPWASLMMPQPWERLSFEMGRAVFLYGHKEEIAQKFGEAVAQNVRETIPLPAGTKPISSECLHQLLPEYRPFELQRGQAFFRPTTAADLSHFVDNLGEYKKRYQHLKWDTFLTQMRFFTETLAAARKNGTQAVVVAMPITDLNRQLLSDLSWDAYKSTIKAVAQQEGAAFIDFSEDGRFSRSDFGDTVHLHALGGQRWLDMVIAGLADNAMVNACLTKPASSVAHAAHGSTL